MVESMVCPQNRGDECTTSNKRILKLLQLRYSVFRLSFLSFLFFFFCPFEKLFTRIPSPAGFEERTFFYFFIRARIVFSLTVARSIRSRTGARRLPTVVRGWRNEGVYVGTMFQVWPSCCHRRCFPCWWTMCWREPPRRCHL